MKVTNTLKNLATCTDFLQIFASLPVSVEATKIVNPIDVANGRFRYLL
jgi:hypothetical protein